MSAFESRRAFLPQLERYREAGVGDVSLKVGFADMWWAEHVWIPVFHAAVDRPAA